MSSRYEWKAKNSSEIEPLVRLWLLRILVPLDGKREFVSSSGFQSDAVAEAIGLGHWLNVESKDSFVDDLRYKRPSRKASERPQFDVYAIRAEIRRIHSAAESEAHKIKVASRLASNVALLTELVGLNAIDCKILEFVVTITHERILNEAGDWLGSMSSAKVFQSLSVILDIPELEVRRALGSQGLLVRAGLVSLHRHGKDSLRDKFNLISEMFADEMCTGEADPVSLLRGTVSAVVEAQLQRSDYQHIDDYLNILQPYLEEVTENRKTGVNVLIHGAPGTGKSQLARVLAKCLGTQLFEVSAEDEDGDPVDGKTRLCAFRAAQSFFSKRRALIVFDEVEDVFNDSDRLMGGKSTAGLRKAWINRILEENPVPALWLTNSISGLDSAFIRRFDMVFELPVPPKQQRKKILSDSCGDLVGEGLISRIAEIPTLAPAIVARASKVLRSVKDQIGPDQISATFEKLVSSTLQAQGHRALIKNDPNCLPETYDPAFINADADLEALALGLASSESGRLCLYGPPGTGKTAYARWLAAQLDRPLIVQRASDLMSPYVGENEQKIARAFRTADADGAVLLIDEIDSFLQDRNSAHRSWEVSMVNEMLTQMESFSGLFIASTNLMDGLDSAALRRFDLKVSFNYLKPEQAEAMLDRYCEMLRLPSPDRMQRDIARGLNRLTPGDFSTVFRQSRFRPMVSAGKLIDALTAECRIKQGQNASMGFLPA